MSSTCTRCGAPIVFVASAKSGKPIPCDPALIEIVTVAPDTQHHLRVTTLISGVTETGAVVRGIEAIPSTPTQVRTAVRISHFATCPHAAEFRKPKGRKQT